MPAEPYLLRLTARLAEALARLPADERALHARFVTAAQAPEGGFTDRHGGADLYYTGFALRSLAVLDALTPEVCERTGAYLKGNLNREASVVDFFSLLYSCLLVQAGGGPNVLAGAPPDWPARVATTLEGFRTADGGYAKGPGGASGSTYHTFLVALCYQLLGREVPRPDEIVRFVLSRRREDGGFVEIAPMRRGGTNPTAAAVGLLQIVEPVVPAFTEEVRGGAIEFLVEMPSFEGGMRANARAPLADLLSTFTACWTLEQLGALDRIDAERTRGYVEPLACAEGGFHGGLWDEGSDVEYTFYGLGALALFAP